MANIENVTNLLDWISLSNEDKKRYGYVKASKLFKNIDLSMLANIQQVAAKKEFSLDLPSTFTYSIPKSQHKLNNIQGYLFTAPNGEEVEIVFKIATNKTITLESNVNMGGCKITIF